MQKRTKENVLRSVVKSYGGTGRKPPVRVVREAFSVLEPESRGFDPYDHRPLPNEADLDARIRRRTSRKKTGI